jgi:hypothetical protein
MNLPPLTSTRWYHIIARAVWVIGSVVVWNYLTLLLLKYLSPAHFININPDGMAIKVISVAAILGFLVVPSIFAVLAMRSRLPGTGPKNGGQRGFPIEATPADQPKNNTA